MKKYILKRKQGAQISNPDLLEIKKHNHVIDDSQFPDLILIESSSNPVIASDKWEIFPEKEYTVPTTQKSVNGDN